MPRIPIPRARRKSHCAHRRKPAPCQANLRAGHHGPVAKRRLIPVSVRRERVHPSRLMTDTAYRREVERCIDIESHKLRQAAELSAGDIGAAKWSRAIKTAKAKARSYQSCGQIVAVRTCDCGVPRSKTAISPPGDPMMRCTMDCCQHCGRRRADILSRNIQSKISSMPLTDKFYLMLITFTEASSPGDPAQYTVESLRGRVAALRVGLRSLWDTKRHLGSEIKGRLKLGNPTSTCFFYRVEISDNGAIHAHGIYYGPIRKKDQIESILKQAWPNAGFVDIKTIANTDQLKLYQKSQNTPNHKLSDVERKVNDNIREVAKYTVKGPSPFDEDHLAGAPRWRLDPALAAKWEIATYGQRLTEWYGTLRGTAEAEAEAETLAAAVLDAEVQTAQQLAEQDGDVVCDCCGLVGGWRWELMSMREYVRSCHARRLKAFLRSRWIPPKRE